MYIYDIIVKKTHPEIENPSLSTLMMIFYFLACIEDIFLEIFPILQTIGIRDFGDESLIDYIINDFDNKN